MLETASVFGIQLADTITGVSALSMPENFDPYTEKDLSVLLEYCMPIIFAVNSLNRSMAQPDLYPFVISPVTTKKLEFVHHLIAASKTKELSSS